MREILLTGLFVALTHPGARAQDACNAGGPAECAQVADALAPAQEADAAVDELRMALAVLDAAGPLEEYDGDYGYWMPVPVVPAGADPALAAPPAAPLPERIARLRRRQGGTMDRFWRLRTGVATGQDKIDIFFANKTRIGLGIAVLPNNRDTYRWAKQCWDEAKTLADSIKPSLDSARTKIEDGRKKGIDAGGLLREAEEAFRAGQPWQGKADAAEALLNLVDPPGLLPGGLYGEALVLAASAAADASKMKMKTVVWALYDAGLIPEKDYNRFLKESSGTPAR